MLAAGREILEACVALGGSITGEHGIGVEKIGADAAPLRARRPARHDARCAPSSIPSGAPTRTRSSPTPRCASRRARRAGRRRCDARWTEIVGAGARAPGGAARRRRRRRAGVGRAARDASPRCRRASRAARARRAALVRERPRRAPRRRRAAARALDVAPAPRPPRRASSTTRPADMTVTVEAGCPLADARRRRSPPRGQWLPLDPPRPEATTVGGLLAANLSGPLRASQGTARDLLLGIRVVGADGALVARRRPGREERRRLRPAEAPRRRARHARRDRRGDVQGAAAAGARGGGRRSRCRDARGRGRRRRSAVLDVDVPPLWLEVAGPGAGRRPGRRAAVVGRPRRHRGGGRRTRVRSSRAARARGLAARARVADGARAPRRASAAFAVAPAAAVLRAATLPAEVGGDDRARSPTRRARARRVRCVAHAANGVVRAAVAERAGVAPLVRALRPGLEARGGSLVVERAAPAVEARARRLGRSRRPGARRSCGGVKAAFDSGAASFAPGPLRRGGALRSACASSSRSGSSRCVHCGLCLAACPTYLELGERGRLAARAHPSHARARGGPARADAGGACGTSTSASAAAPARPRVRRASSTAR